jgi:hypothetical protein
LHTHTHSRQHVILIHPARRHVNCANFHEIINLNEKSLSLRVHQRTFIASGAVKLLWNIDKGALSLKLRIVKGARLTLSHRRTFLALSKARH